MNYENVQNTLKAQWLSWVQSFFFKLSKDHLDQKNFRKLRLISTDIRVSN